MAQSCQNTKRLHNTVVIIKQCCVCQTYFFHFYLNKANKMPDLFFLQIPITTTGWLAISEHFEKS